MSYLILTESEGQQDRSLGNFCNGEPKTFSQCLGESFRSNVVDCGQSQLEHVVERHGESFQQEVHCEQNRRRAQRMIRGGSESLEPQNA